eukprot:CAMPEP_0202886224 /NCGR_PEP_ID=MMETSP1391-20130828/42067_1 /ASSEMBLY_ACC=CAM_ASM_000867 /TAXON_ID=1034604 /ORGANISM="Chlamydomonas leiostraca, Strain SAG 11-49" /LENGTH=50 /DNA_ID=CAMNT_0049569493 /DNA_START=56 /DNA_END=209 /DNA_ORIENTATION=-
MPLATATLGTPMQTMQTQGALVAPFYTTLHLELTSKLASSRAAAAVASHS